MNAIPPALKDAQLMIVSIKWMFHYLMFE